MILIIWTSTGQRARMTREAADEHFGSDWVDAALNGDVSGVYAERE
jgi:hypothetical protein